MLLQSAFLTFLAVGIASGDILVEGGPREQPSFYVRESRAFTSSLYLDNAYKAAGKWGPVDFCPDDSFVSSFEVRYHMPNNLDETAINMVKLYCQEGMVGKMYVTSTIGDKGEDLNMRGCTTGPATGFKAQVLEYQGLVKDDVAVHDITLICNNTEEVTSGIPPPPQTQRAYHIGTWSSAAECAPLDFVCGIQIRFEDVTFGDETAVCDVVMFCCEQA